MSCNLGMCQEPGSASLPCILQLFIRWLLHRYRTAAWIRQELQGALLRHIDVYEASCSSNFNAYMQPAIVSDACSLILDLCNEGAKS